MANEKERFTMVSGCFDQQRADSFSWRGDNLNANDAQALKQDIIRHIVSTLGSDYARKSPFNYYMGLVYAVRDRLIDMWIRTQRASYDAAAKRVYYLSMEYLPGKSLLNNLHCLCLYDTAQEVMQELGFDLEDLAEMEWDAGLGNGGLGRLASCYLDSMATQALPAFGYGIRYEYGIFHQVIENGVQVERSDNWMRGGNPWEFDRVMQLYEVRFFGHVERWTDASGRLRTEWKGANKVMAMACDMLVPGYANGQTVTMRLWAAKSDEEFNLEFFNTGNYAGAVEEKVHDENLSKVLYPSEEQESGKKLRLQQQYFFVCASLQDILRRFHKKYEDWALLPDHVCIQLNDTHPAVAVPELMRILVDEELLEWDKAWEITRQTFAYTNHTVLPEALEVWSLDLFGQVLPRHLEIIFELNHRFMEQMQAQGADADTLSRLSIIQEHPYKAVRMANLSILGSFSVNGVSQLHTDILQEYVFRDFDEIFPGRINNKTNGVTPRRWLLQCNQPLAKLITKHIGEGWINDLDQLKQLEPLAEDAAFRARWRQAKRDNKDRLAAYIKRKTGVEAPVDSMFDVQVKRIHEYKRQLLNVMHVVTHYLRLKDNPQADYAPRTVFFGGKAAPAYHMAKRIIQLVIAVAKTVNKDPDVNDKLKVVFMPNYCVSVAEKIIPATELSEQISMAGMEASGTGNMKFSINGALTIGTLDGANVEMQECIGAENMFIFGHTASEVLQLKQNGYDPRWWRDQDKELSRVLEVLERGTLFSKTPDLFKPIAHSLLQGGDHYCLLADYRAYIEAQQAVDALYKDQEEWTRKSILNSARMGKFSSDRSVADYVRDIWKVQSLI